MFPTTRDASVDGLRDFRDILARWIDAEGRGDARALERLLDAAFHGDGPDGYVLTKDQWLERYRSGGLVNVRFGWHDAEVRVYYGTAVVLGVQSQTSSCQGRDLSGDFRATLVAVRRADRWTIVNLQLTRLSAPPV